MSKTENAGTETVRISRESLERACRIVSEFREMLLREVQEKHNLLLMSSTHEGLGTVLGILSSALTGGEAGLAVADGPAREALSAAYAHMEAVAPNTVDGSPAQAACLQLEAAFHGILDMDYKPGKAQKAVEDVMAAARFGSDLAAALLEAGESSLDDCYLAQDGQKLTVERLEMAKAALDALLPKYDPEKDGANTDGEDDGNGEA